MNREALIAAMQLTAAAAAKPIPVTVPWWGVVHVRALTVAEVEEQAKDTADPEDKGRMSRAAARVLCDEKGERLFDPSDPEDVELLSRQPWQLLRQALEASDATGKDSPKN